MKASKRIGLAVVAAIGVSVAAPLGALAAPGQLDPSFSGDGKVVTNFTSGNDFAGGVAVQPDGKIVTAGSTPSNGGQFVVARYNPNGSLDSSFDGNGKVAVNFTADADHANAMAIQPDGRIVVAGRAGRVDQGIPRARFGLTRLNPNGSLDTSFDGDGRVETDFTAGVDWANSVAIQPDGRIVAAGLAAGLAGTPGEFVLARYNADGSLDTSFDGDGKVAVNIGGEESAEGVAIQPDGKIVVAGWATPFEGSSDARFALARLNADGSLDTGFDGDGMVVTNFTAFFDAASAVAIQADGKIVAAGNTPSNGGQFAFARYNADGSLDTSFDGNGKAAVNFTTGRDRAEGIAIQPDGKMVAAGFTPTNGGQFGLARLNPNGSLDASFDGNGKLATNFTTGDDRANDVAIQPNGRIVAAGRADGSGGRFALARYLAD